MAKQRKIASPDSKAPRLSRTAVYNPAAVKAETTPSAETQNADLEPGVMTIGEHLEELRQRLIRILLVVGGGTALCLFFSPQLHSFMVKPYADLTGQKLLMQNVYGSFEVLIQVSIAVALTVTLPLCFSILWGFITPAVSRRAARIGHIVVLSSSVLFWIGVVFAWIYLVPLGLTFFFQDFLLDSVSPQVTVERYYSFVFGILAGSGAVFEMPLLLVLLGAARIVPFSMHRRIWRYFIVGIFIVAGAVTPPDWISQLVIAGLLLGLYGISLLVLWLIERAQGRADRETNEAASP